MCLFAQSTGEATNGILLLRGRRLSDDPSAYGLRPPYVQGWVVLSSSILAPLGVFVRSAPDRTEPPLWECVSDLFASRLSISNFVCRYVKNIYINLTWRAGVIVVSKVAPAPLVSLSFVSERSSRGCFPSMLSSVSCGAGGVGGC